LDGIRLRGVLLMPARFVDAKTYDQIYHFEIGKFPLEQRDRDEMMETKIVLPHVQRSSMSKVVGCVRPACVCPTGAHRNICNYYYIGLVYWKKKKTV
jgi:hypothetical protein